MTTEEIALQAYYLWENRGCPWGTPEIDWFEAEKVATKEPESLLPMVASKMGSALGTAMAFVKELDRSRREP